MELSGNRKGFSLVEMLMVLALIAILVGIVIIAINPARQLASTRNALRIANINSIIDGVYQYSLDNKGAFPGSITTTPREICKTGASSCAGFIDLSKLTTSKKYLVSIPIDPLVTQGNGVGYVIKLDENRLNAVAIYAELGEVINIIR